MRHSDYLISINSRPSSSAVEHETPTAENTESRESKKGIRCNYNLEVSIFTYL